VSVASRRLLVAVAGSTTLALTAAAFAVGVDAVPQTSRPTLATGQSCLRAVAGGKPTAARQRAFGAAAKTYGVPREVLLGVSYLESRWDDHGASPSTSGGYGPLHLTDVTVPDMSTAKGDGSLITSQGPSSLHTVELAARLTGLTEQRLKSDDTANICAGAALLASYQQGLGQPSGTRTTAEAWYDAVRRYNSATPNADSAAFATRAFTTIRHGAARVTNDGQQVRLAAHPALEVQRVSSPAATSDAASSDCPAGLGCEWIAAPYTWYGAPDPLAYGNHDLASRPADMNIDYIVIHDTEASYATTLDLVTDPTYVSWNYTIRSRDGHIAQHLKPNDVGWQAGNWYVNMHSIGIEHEGFAATGATWYTEAMYRNSAALVAHLAREYGVSLDRAHIIGHDQIPGITPRSVRGMHWDPGPYWNWQHYMRLVGAPLVANRPKGSDVVTVVPGFRGNRQPVTDCDGTGSGACPPQGTNFVYLRTAPKPSAPLVRDVGLHPDGSHSTTGVWDIGARVAAGQKLAVVRRSGAWLGVWYLGSIGWLHSPRNDPVVVPSGGKTVSVKRAATSAPVYGRAYPKASAYPRRIPEEKVVPLHYTIKRGQSYVLADATIETDYFYTKTYDDSVALDHTVVVGRNIYYEIWFGHRMAYVRAADVRIN